MEASIFHKLITKAAKAPKALHDKPFDAQLAQIHRDEARHGKAIEGLLNRYFK